MCCLFGFLDSQRRLSRRQKSRILSALLTESEARGTDASGIAYTAGGRLHIYKRPIPGHRLHPFIPRDAHAMMGHTRLTTQGDAQLNDNNHPFIGRVGELDFALAHNGVLHNDLILRSTRNLPDTKIGTDSYIAVQLLEQQRALTSDSLKQMAEQVEGSFVFTILDAQNTLSFVRGDNPLCIYYFPALGLYLYASTEAILKKAIRKTWLSGEKWKEITTEAGDILQIDAQGNCSTSHFEMPLPWSMWRHDNYASWSCRCSAAEDPYIEELRSMASVFGYAPEDIDRFLKEGFTTDEIEEAFYCYGEM